jgi:hypothetical protein
MKFSTVIALGLAAFAMASPVPEAEAEAEAGVADSITAALPHSITSADKRDIQMAPVDKIMTSVEPVDLVTRQAANTTANAAGTLIFYLYALSHQANTVIS